MEAQSGEYTSGSNETRLTRINKRGFKASGVALRAGAQQMPVWNHAHCTSQVGSRRFLLLHLGTVFTECCLIFPIIKRPCKFTFKIMVIMLIKHYKLLYIQNISPFLIG